MRAGRWGCLFAGCGGEKKKSERKRKKNAREKKIKGLRKSSFFHGREKRAETTSLWFPLQLQFFLRFCRACTLCSNHAILIILLAGGRDKPSAGEGRSFDAVDATVVVVVADAPESTSSSPPRPRVRKRRRLLARKERRFYNDDDDDGDSRRRGAAGSEAAGR